MPKTTTKTPRTLADLTAELQPLIEYAALSEEKLPADQAAVSILDEAEAEVIAEIGQHLTRALVARMIRAERSQQMRLRRQQLLLPGFEHLPVKIQIGDKKRVLLENATYTDVRAYVRALTNRHRDKMREDPKLTEGRALLEKMAEFNRKHPGITVKDVIHRDER